MSDAACPHGSFPGRHRRLLVWLSSQAKLRGDCEASSLFCSSPADVVRGLELQQPLTMVPAANSELAASRALCDECALRRKRSASFE